MSAETAIYSTLIAAPSVTAIVSQRVYPDFLSQEIVLPAIVNQRDETEYVTTIHSGLSLGERINMDTWCLAATRIGADTLADVVENALPAGEFYPIARRSEFDPETQTFAAIITTSIWI